MPVRPAATAALILLALLVPGRVAAQELYFVMVFAAQRVPKNPKYTHTFATFVKATGTPVAGYRLEAHTISWLPRTMNLRVLAPQPECGCNFNLPSTLRWAFATGQRVSLWGPHQIRPELYYAALTQIALLESGKVLYKTVDAGYPTNQVTNCIHAVSALAEGYHPQPFRFACGDRASAQVEAALEPWILGPGLIHPWVATRLGLDGCPLLRQNRVRAASISDGSACRPRLPAG